MRLFTPPHFALLGLGDIGICERHLVKWSVGMCRLENAGYDAFFFKYYRSLTEQAS